MSESVPGSRPKGNGGGVTDSQHIQTNVRETPETEYLRNSETDSASLQFPTAVGACPCCCHLSMYLMFRNLATCFLLLLIRQVVGGGGGGGGGVCVLEGNLAAGRSAVAIFVLTATPVTC